MTKLNFNFIGGLKEALMQLSMRRVVFVRPYGSRLYRVFCAPIYQENKNLTLKLISDDRRAEIVQVLNTVCTRYHKGVWYFRMDEQTGREITDIFTEMNQDNLLVEPEEVLGPEITLN